MFTTLLESRAPRTRRTGGAALSALAHGTLVVLGVAATTKSAPLVHLDAPHQDTVVYVNPAPPITRPQQPSPHSAPADASTPPVDVVIQPPIVPPVGIPPINYGVEVPLDRIGSGVRTPSHGGLSLGPAVPAGGVIDVEFVERAPSVLGAPRPPRYPSVLREAGTNGHVVIRFIIDTLGRAELGELTVLESSHALFTESVKAALMDYRFTPGEVGGRKVRTLVQMPFAFNLR